MLLSELTTMRVGGPATRIVDATTTAQLVDAARETWADGDEWFVLGGGSNVVISDDGFDGTVIRTLTRGIEVVADGDAVRVVAQAGEPWDALVDFAVSNGLAGIEALSGIPGSTGAAPIQNIGAYGQEVGDTLVSVEFLDYLSGDVSRLTLDELGFGYRTSVIKRGRQGVVLSVEFELRRSQRGAVAYPQLAQALGVPLGTEVSIADVRASVLALRAAKGMVLDPADPDSTSCGSFFTNPIVDENFARGLPKDAPRWPIVDDEPDVAVPLGQQPPQRPHHGPYLVKLSAAWLIERAGIGKGFSLPGSNAAISTKHTLAITNRGGATADQVAQLARFVQARVHAEFGVPLHVEPVAIGFQL
ncbi:MAG: UDP-N-acetylmuramate dehydrogenase [Rhodoglobus sp.]